MKQKYAAKGLIMIGSLRKAGVTTYVKQGQVITRAYRTRTRNAAIRWASSTNARKCVTPLHCGR